MVTTSRDGYTIHVTKRDPPVKQGVELKMHWDSSGLRRGCGDIKGEESDFNGVTSLLKKVKPAQIVNLLPSVLPITPRNALWKKVRPAHKRLWMWMATMKNYVAVQLLSSSSTRTNSSSQVALHRGHLISDCRLSFQCGEFSRRAQLLLRVVLSARARRLRAP
ncbi:hypothetical protein Bca52824_076712 [Brassica carinata]|uniref:Uncharacterized protein n=1 Tax=Brassica carinata TaxID=52824 RepID=A0A8X7PVN7_BRACI|nr:hypothetical protein Bca52824_076712 [Brassica carinata]